MNPEEQDQTEFYSVLKNPLRLLREGAQFGLKKAGTLLFTILLFGFANLTLLVYGFVLLFDGDLTWIRILFILIMLIVGLIFTTVAGYYAYRTLIMDALEAVYKRSSNLFFSLSQTVVQKADLIRQKGSGTFADLDSVFNISDWVKNKFSAIPRVFQKAMILVLRRVPIVNMLKELNQDMINNQQETAAAKLYTSLDKFIMENFFGANRTRTFILLFLINLLLQFLVIYFKILV